MAYRKPWIPGVHFLCNQPDCFCCASPVVVYLLPQCLLQASGIASNVTADTAWTILAPSNSAFTDRLATLSLTPEQLLLPENRATLVSVSGSALQPARAVMASSPAGAATQRLWHQCHPFGCHPPVVSAAVAAVQWS